MIFLHVNQKLAMRIENEFERKLQCNQYHLPRNCFQISRSPSKCVYSRDFDLGWWLCGADVEDKRRREDHSYIKLWCGVADWSDYILVWGENFSRALHRMYADTD